jgi:hypothetical protein
MLGVSFSPRDDGCPGGILSAVGRADGDGKSGVAGQVEGGELSVGEQVAGWIREGRKPGGWMGCWGVFTSSEFAALARLGKPPRALQAAGPIRRHGLAWLGLHNPKAGVHPRPHHAIFKTPSHSDCPFHPPKAPPEHPFRFFPGGSLHMLQQQLVNRHPVACIRPVQHS